MAVETSPPYPVTVLRLTDRALAAGEKLIYAWMERLHVWEKSGEFPAYSQAPTEEEQNVYAQNKKNIKATVHTSVS